MKVVCPIDAFDMEGDTTPYLSEGKHYEVWSRSDRKDKEGNVQRLGIIRDDNWNECVIRLHSPCAHINNLVWRLW